MRIIAGEFRSRRLKSLPGAVTRPTPDRLRETLFDILSVRIEGASFIDAYAGTGAVGIEALSRGAARVVFLERDRKAADIIRENLFAFGATGRGSVIQGAAATALALYHADIVFLDPPYNFEREYPAAMQTLAANPPSLVIAQHSVRFELAPTYGPLERFRTVRQGDNVLSFYKSQDAEPRA